MATGARLCSPHTEGSHSQPAQLPHELRITLTRSPGGAASGTVLGLLRGPSFSEAGAPDAGRAQGAELEDAAFRLLLDLFELLFFPEWGYLPPLTSPPPTPCPLA